MGDHAGVARSGRSCRGVAAALAVLALALPAAAATPKLQAVGEATFGVSDNVTSAPDVPLPGGAERTPGAFLILRPGIIAALLTARTVQRLSYTYDYDIQFAEAVGNSSSNRLEYRGFFDLSPRISALLGAAATQASSYSALTLAPPGSGVMPVLPGGEATTLQLSADEQVNFDLGVGWRAFEAIGVGWGTPIFDTEAPTTIAPFARLGVEYSLIADAFGVEARAEYAVIRDGVRADGVEVPLQQQLVTTGVGTWRHDLGRVFTSRVEAGVLRVDRINTDQSSWYPTAGATLAYADIIGDAQLSYVHTVRTDALLGQSLLVDEVRLRGGIPLDQRARFLLSGSVGYQDGRLLDENAELASNVSVLLADVSFGWQTNEYLLLGLRGQHIDQRSDTRVVTLPVSYVQNSVMLGALVKFPPEPTMPRAYREPQRVDRGDELRDGESPAERMPSTTAPRR
jgi:hypothetical protein